MPDAPAPLTPQDFAVLEHASTTCLLVHDAETQVILWANPAACDALGLTLEEIASAKPVRISARQADDDNAAGRAWINDALEHGSSRREWELRSKPGAEIPTDAVAVRVELSRGPAVMVQFRDIARERRMARELSLASSLIDELGRHTTTIAAILDGDGVVLAATAGARESLNGGEELTGTALHSVVEVILPGGVANVRDLGDDARRTVPIRLRLRGAGPGPRWLEGSIERRPAAVDGVFLLIVHDISDRLAEEQRREREIQHENYLARYDAMGDMAMAIAHELAQPLAAAGNFVAGTRARLATGSMPPQAAEIALSNAQQQLERAATVVDAVRRYVAHLEHVEQVVDLNDIVDECLYFLRLRAIPAGVTLDVRLEQGASLAVVCERVLTQQAMMNLGFNAIDEAASCPPDRRRVTIRTRRVEGGAAFTVDDRGRGIPESVDPFHQTFTSKEDGSGLGLALTYRIITRQHGEIWAQPSDEGGAQFGFRLPAPRDRA